MIQLDRVSKSYPTVSGRHEVLAEVSLDRPVGSMTALMGPSGSGKSTLVRLCAGLERPDSGTIVIDGVKVTGLSARKATDLRLRTVGVVFQDHTLIRELSAVENAELPLRAMRHGRAPARAAALEMLEYLDIVEVADRRPDEISGGQQQRVGIARALLGGRTVLLADEPTGALDRASTEFVFAGLRQAADRGVTVMVATHDRSILSWADSTVEIDGGELV